MRFRKKVTRHQMLLECNKAWQEYELSLVTATTRLSFIPRDKKKQSHLIDMENKQMHLRLVYNAS